MRDALTLRRITGMLRDFRKCDLSINAEVIQFIFEIKKRSVGEHDKIPVFKT